MQLCFLCHSNRPAIAHLGRVDETDADEPETVQPYRGNEAMNFRRSFNDWRRYRRTVFELSRMSDRELGDIGIARDDIRRVARSA